jgi:Phosphotransferase enzyme family
MTLLGTLIGEGREAEVYAYGDDAVLKLYRAGFGGYRAEPAALRALDGYGVAPRLLDIVDSDGRTGLVVERIDGPDLLTLVQRRPRQVFRIARTLAATQLTIHGVQAPDGLPGVREQLAARIEDAVLSRELKDFALTILDGLPDGDRLCHGDYHPGNVLLAGDHTAVIDWTGAARGVPEADYARTMLLLRWADPLPGTPLAQRALIATGRSLLARTYARSYRRGSSPLRQPDSWFLVHVAARLSEGIPSEHGRLTAFLSRARG